jgi:hypothetical protein
MCCMAHSEGTLALVNNAPIVVACLVNWEHERRVERSHRLCALEVRSDVMGARVAMSSRTAEGHSSEAR